MKVAIITALPLEYKAVRRFLTDCKEAVSKQGNVYETGNYHNRFSIYTVQNSIWKTFN